MAGCKRPYARLAKGRVGGPLKRPQIDAGTRGGPGSTG